MKGRGLFIACVLALAGCRSAVDDTEWTAEDVDAAAAGIERLVRQFVGPPAVTVLRLRIGLEEDVAARIRNTLAVRGYGFMSAGASGDGVRDVDCGASRADSGLIVRCLVDGRELLVSVGASGPLTRLRAGTDE